MITIGSCGKEKKTILIAVSVVVILTQFNVIATTDHDCSETLDI